LPLKICFVSNAIRTGGAERVLLETIEILAERNFECHVLVPAEGEFSRELFERAIPYSTVHSASLATTGTPSLWRRTKAALQMVIATGALVRRFRRLRPGLIYSNTILSGYASLAAKILAIPHVWHVHEFGQEDHGLSFNLGERFSCRLVAKCSSAVIVVSHALARKYQKYVSAENLRTIYPAMNLTMSANGHGSASRSLLSDSAETNKRFRCLVVGGLAPGKRQEDAVRAFSQLEHRGVDAELVVIGGEEYPQYLELLRSIANDSKWAKQRVIFLGQVPEARELMANADAVLVCSRSEAFGRVTIEGMLAGKPVIGANGGATPELVRDAFNGFIFPVGDVDKLAEKIAFLCHNRSTAERLGENGREWAKSMFNKDRFTNELLGVLKSLPSGKRSCETHNGN
jgi:glycosyltransferase involved in cell wall biosynthesis